MFFKMKNSFNLRSVIIDNTKMREEGSDSRVLNVYCRL